MNEFVRTLSVLSVLWALCELLLPDGKHIARLTVSALVMTALLSSLGQLLHTEWTLPTFSEQMMQAGAESYQRTVLRSAADQLEGYCVRQARKAGYEAEAAVWLQLSGAVEKLEVTVSPNPAALITPEELALHLSETLECSVSVTEGT